ncbi:Glutathione S-transferase-like protein ustS [Psilocybe cubensis]|uniref:Glutathione S-transferase-like protein ustS n=2 Tax=Psilocybe cubensis TaxID=181762 RepID=A0ACB8GYR3_PSICU|nr:Glutathione S-transferase-like protein ustS [Psilocybe cubensis]KAH9480880.1 Glutathione S-transferase-like protein ustS [Psilocybe cubensis]
MTIVLYDVPSSLPGKIWNPNVCKARFSLNVKGIPFTTHWVEYPEIEPQSKKLGALPTRKKADGSPMYTVPFIHDLSTGAVIADSILIAEYLEKTYPATPKLFPNGTRALQAAMGDSIFPTLEVILCVTYPEMMPRFTPATMDHATPILERVRTKNRAEDWKKLKECMDKINGWYARNDESGTYIFGETPTWADIVLAAWLFYARRALDEDSENWKDICSWNDGRWKRFTDAFRRYEGL